MRKEDGREVQNPESRPSVLAAPRNMFVLLVPAAHPDHLFSHHDSRDRKARLVYYQCKKRLARRREASVLCCGDLDQATLRRLPRRCILPGLPSIAACIVVRPYNLEPWGDGVARDSGRIGSSTCCYLLTEDQSTGSRWWQHPAKHDLHLDR